MVELREITKDNYEAVIRLKVSCHQENFVSTPVHALAQAWVYQNNAFPFAVYADGVLVGFIMLGYYEAKHQYTLWKFMIDEKHQNKGYGKAALALGIQSLIQQFNVKEVFTGVAPQNAIAIKLYQSVGFGFTGASDESQLEMKLVIHDSAAK